MNDMTNTGGRLAGSVAIVTGSSGLGLGSEIATLFAEEGARVVVSGRDQERSRIVAERITGAGGDAHPVVADLTDPQACQDLVAATIDAYGDLNILVNSAVSLSTDRDGPVADIDLEVWAEVMRVNVTSVVHLCQAAIPAMVDKGGSIVNVGSRTAIRGTPRLAAYSASKGALHALTRSIAVDYAADGIRCNTVSPGFILGKERAGELPEERRRWAEAMHLTPPPTTRDVAFAVLYLASSESAAITGETVVIDGGGSMARAATLG